MKRKTATTMEEPSDGLGESETWKRYFTYSLTDLVIHLVLSSLFAYSSYSYTSLAFGNGCINPK